MAAQLGLQGGTLPCVTTLAVFLSTAFPEPLDRLAPAGETLALILMQLFFYLHADGVADRFSLQRALLYIYIAFATYSSACHFATDDYLVSTCGLTRKQAAKAAKHSKADITLLVAKDPRILSCSVDDTLRIRVDLFHRYDFSAAQIRSFVRVAPCSFRTFNIDEKLGFWIPLLGSPDKFLRIVSRGNYLVAYDIDKVVKTNLHLLQDCGLSV
uniref:Uncharacterized protein n=1 Tax=Zea mays TaxID=4577 RepID=A0A804U993_MAIZE